MIRWGGQPGIMAKWCSLLCKTQLIAASISRARRDPSWRDPTWCQILSMFICQCKCSLWGGTIFLAFNKTDSQNKKSYSDPHWLTITAWSPRSMGRRSSIKLAAPSGFQEKWGFIMPALPGAIHPWGPTSLYSFNAAQHGSKKNAPWSSPPGHGLRLPAVEKACQTASITHQRPLLAKAQGAVSAT